MDFDAARKAYQRDGACVLRGAFDPSWLETLARGIETALAEPGPYAERYGPPGQERFFGDLDMWTRVPEFADFIAHSPAGEIAGRIMDATRTTFLYDQMLVKEPGSQARTPWHQDQPYWAVEGKQVCSIWLPLDHVAKDVSLEFVAGSHNWGQSFNPQHFDDGRQYADTGLPPLPDIENNRDAYEILSWEMEPGDCVVFQAMEVHGAPANPTAARRRVLATRWLGDDAVYRTRSGEIAIPTITDGLVEGEPYGGPRHPTVWESRI